MSSSKPDIDAKMMDWLYGELDSVEAKSFEDHLAKHPADRAEVEALQRTRVAFQDLDDVEPTNSLSAILMHEAARAVATKPTLWERLASFFQPLAMHPAASAMATLVLVCGVAGAIYLKKGAMVAEPSASSPSTSAVNTASLEAARDPAPAPQAEQALPNKQAEADGYSYGSYGLANEGQQAAIEEAEARAATVVDPSDVTKTRALRYEDSSLANKESGPTRGVKQEFAKKPGGPGADNLDDVFAEPASGGARADAPTTVNGRATVAKKSDKSAADMKADENAQTWEESQKQSLLQLAKSKRCKEVGQIANDILDKNSAYYKAEVEKSKAADDCRYYIASETTRRANTRAKQAARAKKAKQGDSVPPKALAAPVEKSRASDQAEGL